jgi:hypothetical protein
MSKPSTDEIGERAMSLSRAREPAVIHPRRVILSEAKDRFRAKAVETA